MECSFGSPRLLVYHIMGHIHQSTRSGHTHDQWHVGIGPQPAATSSTGSASPVGINQRNALSFGLLVSLFSWVSSIARSNEALFPENSLMLLHLLE